MADDFKDISHLYKVTPSAKTIIDGEDLVETKQKSKAYAWCDVLQSVTGLILGLFLFCHMGFTSSILLGKDTFWSLVSLTGGYFIDGVDHLWMHSVFVGVIFVLVVIHAILALRKFPNNPQPGVINLETAAVRSDAARIHQHGEHVREDQSGEDNTGDELNPPHCCVGVTEQFVVAAHDAEGCGLFSCSSSLLNFTA